MDKHTVLLVEDNDDDVQLMLYAFKKAQINVPVIVVKDGVEALDYLFTTGKYADRNPQDTPTAIFLDLKMPKINGLEVLERIRADDRTRLLPVVILTTSTEKSDLMKSYELGANSYVHKQINFDRFSQVAQQLSQYWVNINRSITQL